MSPIELLMMLFLNMSEPCNALPAEVQSLGRQDYQILAWQCGDKKFKIWQKACEGKYWSRPFFLEEENSQSGIYQNQFAELQTGYHVNINETYVPRCGA
jgi:hypothetical protein